MSRAVPLSIFLERSKVLTAPTTEASPGQDPNTGWQLLEQALLPFEGPETIKLNKDDELNTKDDDGYILLSDNFAYRAFMTTGAELSKTTWDNPMTKRYPDFNNEKKPVKAEPGAQGYITQGANGGLPDKVRHGAFVNVPESVLKVTKSWTAANPTHIEAVDSTTKAVYNAGTRELTATVTAADKGTLAGSVKFSAGDWSKTVKLDAEGKATVTLPASVSGTVAVAYDGYTDGLVNPSDTTVDGIEQGKVDLAELNKQIAAAEALKESDYTAESWTALVKAREAAQAVADNDKATAYDVALALTNLESAIAGLEKTGEEPGPGPVEVNKTDLQTAVNKASKLEKADYTTNSWEAFAEALKAAQQVLDNKNATQQDVDTALSALQDAISKLEAATEPKPNPEPGVVDKAALNATINKAAAINLGLYTDDSANALRAALKKAREVSDNSNATQKQVDAAREALEKAIAGLVKRTAAKGDGNVVSNTGANVVTIAVAGLLLALFIYR